MRGKAWTRITRTTIGPCPECHAVDQRAEVSPTTVRNLDPGRAPPGQGFPEPVMPAGISIGGEKEGRQSGQRVVILVLSFLASVVNPERPDTRNL